MEQLPCDPEVKNTARCDVYRKLGRCIVDKHHLFHPRRDYKTKTEQEFRNLDENIVEGCRNFHNLDHAIFAPPTKPDAELMEMAILEARNRRTEGSQDGTAA